MKTICKIMLFVTMIVFLSSCGNDWLNTLPSNRVPTVDAIANLGDAKSALNGIYYYLQRSSYHGATTIWYGDIRGDDVMARSSTYTPWYLYDYTVTNASITHWEFPYTAIRFANNILEAIDNIEVATLAEAAERDQIKGEAYLVRALAHFDVCNVYGYPYMKDNGASLGASIVTTIIQADAQVPRSTVAECYNELIIPDLLTAIPLLPSVTNRKGDQQGRFNRWTAKLLLSRVYLYKGDNAKALLEAEECIAGALASGYALFTNANYVSQWGEKFSSESLFEIINITGQRTGLNGIANCWYIGSSSQFVNLTRSFYDFLCEDPNDVRLQILTSGSTVIGYPAFILKYNSGAGDVQNANVMLFRLSEAYLNAAEAAVKLNQNDKAIQYFNPIVSRANPANSVTGSVTLEMVIDERRRELVGEGHRVFDLLRNGMKIVRTGPGHNSQMQDYAREIDWNNYRCVMPIPLREMETNLNMVQNPGWGVH